MMKSIENKGKTATGALKNAGADKALFGPKKLVLLMTVGFLSVMLTGCKKEEDPTRVFKY